MGPIRSGIIAYGFRDVFQLVHRHKTPSAKFRGGQKAQNQCTVTDIEFSHHRCCLLKKLRNRFPAICGTQTDKHARS